MVSEALKQYLSAMGQEYAPQITAKGVEKVFEYIDTKVHIVDPAVVPDPAPHQKLSTWLNMAMGLGLPFIAYSLKKGEKVALSAGGHFFSTIVDIGEEYWIRSQTTTTAASAVAAARARAAQEAAARARAAQEASQGSQGAPPRGIIWG